MFNTKKPVATIVLAIVAPILIAACDKTVTDPTAIKSVRPAAAARHDDSDTLACLSGYVMVGGRVVCN